MKKSLLMYVTVDENSYDGNLSDFIGIFPSDYRQMNIITDRLNLILFKLRERILDRKIDEEDIKLSISEIFQSTFTISDNEIGVIVDKVYAVMKSFYDREFIWKDLNEYAIPQITIGRISNT